MKSGRTENLKRDIKKDSNLKSGKEIKETYSFRIEPSKHEALKKHFEDQGRTISNGIQWIMDQYIKDNELM